MVDDGGQTEEEPGTSSAFNVAMDVATQTDAIETTDAAAQKDEEEDQWGTIYLLNY
jgi:hypothetical protein